MNKEKVYKFKCKRLHNNYLINVLFKLLIKIFRIQIIFIAFSLIADHSPDQTGAYPLSGLTHDIMHPSPPSIKSNHVNRSLTSGIESPYVWIGYVVPSDRTVIQQRIDALQYVFQLGQWFYQDQMELNGFGSKTFLYETEPDGITPKIEIIHLSETAAALWGHDEYDQWYNVLDALENAGIQAWKSGIVRFLANETCIQNTNGSIEGGIALGGSFGSAASPGIAMFGCAELAMIGPQLLIDESPYDGIIRQEVGPYPMDHGTTFHPGHGYTFSELCSSFIGGMMHELGHAFGILTHTYRYQVVNQEALMGTGYIYTRGNFRPDLFYLEYTRLSYGSALILNSSHYFNRDLQITGNPIVSAEILNDGIPVNGHRQIKFTASDPDGLGAAILQ